MKTAIAFILIGLAVFLGGPSRAQDDEPEKPAKAVKYTHAVMFRAAFAARAPLLATLGTVDKLGVIHVWDTRDWRLVSTFTLYYLDDLFIGNLMESYDIVLSPDGTKIAFCDSRGSVSLWQVWSGRPIFYLYAPVGPNARVAWSPDGNMVAAGGDCIVRVWSARTSRCLQTIPGTGWVAFSPDGRVLGTASDFDVTLWNIKTGKKIRTLRGKADVFRPIAFSPDGKYVAAHGEDPNWKPKDTGAPAFYHHPGRINIWNRRTGRLIKTLVGEDLGDGGGASELLFYDKGRKLLIGSDWGIRMVDVRSGEDLNGFGIDTGGAALSPDSKMVVVSRNTKDEDAILVYDTAGDDTLLKIISMK